METLLEHVASMPTAPVEAQRVARCEGAHHLAQIVISILEQQVNVVGHETPGQDAHAEPLRVPSQVGKKRATVGIILEEVLPTVSAQHYVIEARC